MKHPGNLIWSVIFGPRKVEQRTSDVSAEGESAAGEAVATSEARSSAREAAEEGGTMTHRCTPETCPLVECPACGCEAKECEIVRPRTPQDEPYCRTGCGQAGAA